MTLLYIFVLLQVDFSQYNTILQFNQEGTCLKRSNFSWFSGTFLKGKNLMDIFLNSEDLSKVLQTTSGYFFNY